MAEGMQTQASASPAGQVSVSKVAAGVRSVSPSGKPTVWLTGRVEDSHQVMDNKTHTPVLDREGRPVFETVIVIPAVDQYSYPSRFRIMSRSNLGRVGSELAIEVELQSFERRVNNYRFFDVRLVAV